MSEHALLSPSSAHRWLNCPLAPRLEATLPDKTSSYAAEGTLAHSVCELTAKKYFTPMKTAEFNRNMKKLKSHELWNDEMIQTAETYVGHLKEKAMGFKNAPYVALEVKVDISEYVPEAFGRCDCIMFGNSTLIITDYKHGKGVAVSAKENPQMMLYALGALKLYQPIFGNAIEKINICIDQPRIDSYENWECSKAELLAWGESVKPKAQKAFMGIGEYNAGTWCRFCRANGICKAQADNQISAFDDFKEVVAEGKTDLLTPEQIGEALKKGEILVNWYEALQKTALEKLLSGAEIPGYKVVEGRSSRAWTNQDKALETLQNSGIERAVIYDSVPKSLAQIEKMLGATKFAELVGSYVFKPQGKPTLANATDKRPIFNSAVADFAAVVKK